jgi:predicted N-acetyltransferase YhbS
VSIWVRLATPDDAPALSALALQAKRHWGYPPEWIDRWKEELTITPAYLARHAAFVAAENGVPIGMCALEQRADGGAIENVWIAPNRHRLGVGRALVRRALREAAVAGMTSVRVVSDPYAEGFYSRLGAERRGEVPSPMPGAPDRTLPVLCFAVAGRV